MDPAEVPNQLKSRRRAARDHQPALQRGRGRCVERVDSLRSIRNFVVLVSTAAADRARATPCPSRIQLAEAWRHPDDRPQVADRGRRSRCFAAPGSQRPPAALSRRVTAADIMCSVVPPPARSCATSNCSVTRPPARPPAHLSRRPFAQSPLTPHVLSHRRDITPAQAPRDGSAHSCGSTRTYGATPPRLGAAHGSNRCRPTTRLLPLPLSAMRPLRQCTPRTRRQIPLRRATFAAMRPPPALIVTTRLLRYTFLPCAGERTAAAIDGGAAGRVRE